MHLDCAGLDHSDELSVIRANRLFSRNILFLLAATDTTQRRLATALHRHEAWLSKILAGQDANKRSIRLVDLDGIAGFFGLKVWQLFSEEPVRPAASLRRRGPVRPPGRRSRS